ncbi:ATPase AAA [Methanobrevibacter sp. YE315]|uniref:ATP-binding protein n=1 Tax=Methanobrevibacter sp. YE315 TaxID=1609968 RepID=UPI000764CFD4|nr:AAA family ATPase [Methanobrevibacter sp. YE315]AMD17414.1 ATPase AAA [Methanobrevibacter sp. YE315]
MNDLQKRYIRNQILTMPMKVNQELTHKNKKFNQRSDYDNIIRYIDNFLDGEGMNRFLVLPGLRDVGKTTILFQAYEYLLMEKNINQQNILYLSCDRLKRTGEANIFDVVNYYCKTFHNSIFETLSEPVFILIDEAQYDKEWALNGKLIFDGSKNIFMIFSGSSALKLSNNPDAARRLLNIPIYTLTYSQHLKLKYGNFKNDISDSIIQMIFDGETQNSAEIERRMINIYSNFQNFDVSEWKNFLQFGGFPSSFYQNTNDINKKIVNMVEKVVMTDMNNIEGINGNTHNLAFQILNYLAFQNPGEVSIGSLSNLFDAKKQLVTKVLNILEKTQLIFHIGPFTSSVKRTTKPNEYFFATPSLKHNLALDVGNALLEDEPAYFGKLLENYVASSFHDLDNKSTISYKTYYDDSKRKSSDKNVDFIVQRGLEKPIPIEVSCGDKDKSQIKRAINAYNSSHGIIISNTTSNIVKTDNIICIPPEIFAFM